MVTIKTFSDTYYIHVCAGCESTIIIGNITRIIKLANANVWIGGSSLAVVSAFGDVDVVGKIFTTNLGPRFISRVPLLGRLKPTGQSFPLVQLRNILRNLASRNHDLVLVMRHSQTQIVGVLA